MDEGITFADLKGTLETFARALFGEDRRLRLGAGVLPVRRARRAGRGVVLRVRRAGCRVLGSGWIELLGLRAWCTRGCSRTAAYDPERYTGFAFGVGHRPGRDAPLRGSPTSGCSSTATCGSSRSSEASAMGCRSHGCASSCRPTWSPRSSPICSTPRGVKVEAIERPWEGLDGVVVAARARGPRPPELRQAVHRARRRRRRASDEVVVGVRNMAPGDLVPWARPGARVPVLDGPLERQELRGVDLERDALLAPGARGLRTSTSGHPAPARRGLTAGADLRSALGLDDAVLDIEIEPTGRTSCPIFGVAREVAAATGRAARRPRRRPVAEAEERGRRVATDRDRRTATAARATSRGSSEGVGRARRRSASRRGSPPAACGRSRRRRRDELRDARARSAAARVRPRSARRSRASSCGEPSDGERLETLDGVERELTTRIC